MILYSINTNTNERIFLPASNINAAKEHENKEQQLWERQCNLVTHYQTVSIGCCCEVQVHFGIISKTFRAQQRIVEYFVTCERVISQLCREIMFACEKKMHRSQAQVSMPYKDITDTNMGKIGQLSEIIVQLLKQLQDRMSKRIMTHPCIQGSGEAGRSSQGFFSLIVGVIKAYVNSAKMCIYMRRHRSVAIAFSLREHLGREDISNSRYVFVEEIKQPTCKVKRLCITQPLRQDDTLSPLCVVANHQLLSVHQYFHAIVPGESLNLHLLDNHRPWSWLPVSNLLAPIM